jgi:hypothetical protein
VFLKQLQRLRPHCVHAQSLGNTEKWRWGNQERGGRQGGRKRWRWR